MPSTTPIIESIRLNLVTALQTLVTAGYATAVVQPKTYAKDGDFDHGNLILVQHEGKLVEEATEARVDSVTKDQTFEIACCIRKSDSDTGAVDSYVNALCARVESAIMADPLRGNYALDTEWSGSAPLGINRKQIDGARVYVTVRYAHQRNDPCTR